MDGVRRNPAEQEAYRYDSGRHTGALDSEQRQERDGKAIDLAKAVIDPA